MPASYLMSWEGKARRWWKMKDGKRHVVSVKQLSKFFHQAIPETQEGSYQWANRWWRERVKTLEPTPEVHPHDAELKRLTHNLKWAERLGKADEAANLSAHIRDVEKMGEDQDPLYDPDEQETIERNLGVAKLAGIKVPEELPTEFVRHFFGNRRVEQDRYLREPNAPPAPPERTVGDLISRYLETLMTRYRANEISVSEFSNARAGLFHFRDWVGATVAVDQIDANKWDAYYLFLMGEQGPKSGDTRRKNFRYARNFLTWLGDLGINPVPLNLDRKQYRFKGTPKEIPTLSGDVIKKTVAESKGQLRLHLLLMLNCGFTQQDVSDLHPSEVDWEIGRIRRRRSKTGDHRTVPVVDYLLWKETFTLLKRYRSESPDHVLLTESGLPWVRDGVKEDGSRSRTDSIQSNYSHVKVYGKGRLKDLRKAGSTTLDGSTEHGKYAVFFLGHAPDLAHKHYINQNGAGFDEAVKWLGGQFGF